MIFRDRKDAGEILARRLLHYRGRKPVVLALPRGGVPVGYEIAKALDAPLDIVLVRKIGVPFQPELALGAVADGEHPDVFIDEELKRILDIPDSYVAEERERQLAEIGRRQTLYREGRAAPEIAGHTAIVVDDGIATGATMRVALRAIARMGAAAIVLAIPVAPPSAVAALRREVDEIVCLQTPELFDAIGCFYQDFAQLTDEEVVRLLRARQRERGPADGGNGERSPTAPG